MVFRIKNQKQRDSLAFSVSLRETPSFKRLKKEQSPKNGFCKNGTVTRDWKICALIMKLIHRTCHNTGRQFNLKIQYCRVRLKCFHNNETKSNFTRSYCHAQLEKLYDNHEIDPSYLSKHI